MFNKVNPDVERMKKEIYDLKMSLLVKEGVIKELKRVYQDANILALDYDASVSNVNQLNRIKLLMAVSKA